MRNRFRILGSLAARCHVDGRRPDADRQRPRPSRADGAFVVMASGPRVRVLMGSGARCCPSLTCQLQAPPPSTPRSVVLRPLEACGRLHHDRQASTRSTVSVIAAACRDSECLRFVLPKPRWHGQPPRGRAPAAALSMAPPIAPRALICPGRANRTSRPPPKTRKRSVPGAQVSAGNGSPRVWAVISSLR
jgi:hypothetical protein